MNTVCNIYIQTRIGDARLCSVDSSYLASVGRSFHVLGSAQIDRRVGRLWSERLAVGRAAGYECRWFHDGVHLSVSVH